MIYPGKFGGIPSTGSRDLVGPRFCHADADMNADSNGIRVLQPIRPPSPLMRGGGHKLISRFIVQNNPKYLDPSKMDIFFKIVSEEEKSWI